MTGISIHDFSRHPPPFLEDFDGLVTKNLSHGQPARGRGQRQFTVESLVVKSRPGGVGARGREDDALHPRPIGRAQTHRARLATGVKNASLQHKRTQPRRRRANGHDFRMGRRVVARGDLVPAGGDDFIFPHHDGAEWPAVPGAHVLRGQLNGALDEIEVPGVWRGLHFLK